MNAALPVQKIYWKIKQETHILMSWVNNSHCLSVTKYSEVCPAHHACSCPSPRGLELLEEVLQLLPFDVAVSCGAPEELNEFGTNDALKLLSRLKLC